MTQQDISSEVMKKLIDIISCYESGKINIYSAVLKAYSVGMFHGALTMKFVEEGDKNETK